MRAWGLSDVADLNREETQEGGRPLHGITREIMANVEAAKKKALQQWEARVTGVLAPPPFFPPLPPAPAPPSASPDIPLLPPPLFPSLLLLPLKSFVPPPLPPPLPLPLPHRHRWVQSQLLALPLPHSPKSKNTAARCQARTGRPSSLVAKNKTSELPKKKATTS